MRCLQTHTEAFLPLDFVRFNVHLCVGTCSDLVFVCHYRVLMMAGCRLNNVCCVCVSVRKSLNTLDFVCDCLSCDVVFANYM